MDITKQQECFESWMTEHIGILHRTVNGFATGEDRKDLLQEVMLAVWKAIPSFRKQSKVSTFLYLVAHNTALNWRRSQKNYLRKLGEYESMLMPGAVGNRGAENRELLGLLYSEIRKLEPVDRSLALLFLDDLSYRDMAEIHGISESNVGVRLNRLKQKLAQSMKETTHEY